MSRFLRTGYSGTASPAGLSAQVLLASWSVIIRFFRATLLESGMLSSQSRTSLLKSGWNAAIVVILLMGAGCGGPDYGTPVSVSGKVTLDGEPLGELTVIYHNTSGLPAEFRTQRATTDGQGVYTLPKVYPGEYRILFEKIAAAPEDPGMAPAEMSAAAFSLVKYTGDNAPTASISESNTEVNFELDSKS